VFTARYELTPYIKQARFIFKGLIQHGVANLLVENKTRKEDYAVVAKVMQFYNKKWSIRAIKISKQRIILIWEIQRKCFHDLFVPEGEGSVFCRNNGANIRQ
jgi:hypothetical protein